MRFLMLVATVSVAPTLIAEQTQRPDWNLQVGLFGYRHDGTVSTMAFETQLSSKSFVYITEGLCGLGAGLGPRSRNATHAWSFTGKEIEVTPELAIIQLDWQRVIDNGQPATGPGGSVQLTVQAGEHVMLDSALPHHAASCWSTVGFEVRYRANPVRYAQLTVRPDGSVRAGGGSLVAPSGAASSDGSGRPNVSAGSGGSGASATVSRHPPVTSSNYEVHLWLVRSAPGRPEESQYRQLSIGGAPVLFSFGPLTIQTPHGGASAIVSGTLDAKGRLGTESLFLQVERRVTAPAGGVPIAGESTGYVRLQPAADKVMSIELPPIRLGEQQLPDRLSLRVRVQPR